MKLQEESRQRLRGGSVSTASSERPSRTGCSHHAPCSSPDFFLGSLSPSMYDGLQNASNKPQATSFLLRLVA